MLATTDSNVAPDLVEIRLLLNASYWGSIQTQKSQGITYARLGNRLRVYVINLFKWDVMSGWVPVL